MGVDARGFPGRLLRLDPTFAYVEPPSSLPLPWAECLTLAPNRKQCQTLFFWAPKSLQMVTAAMKLKDAYSLEGKL